MTTQPAAGSWVLALDDPGADLAVAGGKGASLSRLAAAGLPVPAGFHVSTDAYRLFVADGLDATIAAALVDAGPAPSPGDAQEAADRIAEAFTSRPVPAGIAHGIVEAYTALGADPAVAVRSSATAEDLPDASFAGQQDTFLNVRGTDAVVDAVRRCWASLWTARAIAYRARHGIGSDDVAIAVVVQLMVRADSSGVLFTADPTTGRTDRMLVNASWGLGDAVVGGTVTPDSLELDPDGHVRTRRTASKDVMTVVSDAGTTDAPVLVARRNEPVLDDASAAELADLGRRIAGLLARPADIEWARHQGRFLVLQARPITALADPEDPWNDSRGVDHLWCNGNLGEAIPDVMTPSTWSFVEIFMTHAMASASLPGHRGYGRVGGRFYLDLSVSAALARATGVSLRRFVELTEPTYGRLPPDLDIPVPALGRATVLRALLPVVVALLRRARANGRRLPAFLAANLPRCEALHERITRASDSTSLGALWHEEVGPALVEASEMLEVAGRQGGGALVFARRRLVRLVGDADTDALLSGLDTGTDPLASLGPLLGLARLESGELDRAEWVRRYGHRSPHEFEVSLPRPAEDPAGVERALAGLREGPSPTELLRRRAESGEQARQRLRRDHPRRVRRARRQVERWRDAERTREAARSEVTRVFAVLRAFVLRAGAITEHGDDLFFCSIEEILAVLAGDDRPLAAVESRRRTHARYAALPPYPALVRGEFDPFRWARDPHRRADVFDARGAAPPSEGITGFPGAAGVVEGDARVLTHTDQGEELRPGEILVTTVTNVGWTPLFPRAAAVVTDVGAPLSHAAIVARELAIPAVVGCGNATTRIRTGDRLRVDGGRGTVELLPRQDAAPIS